MLKLDTLQSAHERHHEVSDTEESIVLHHMASIKGLRLYCKSFLPTTYKTQPNIFINY